jgi:hypothetical protein
MLNRPDDDALNQLPQELQQILPAFLIPADFVLVQSLASG